MGEKAGMRQARISAMERPGEAKFNIDTLVRLAAALKVGLSVRFVSFSEMLQWENNFSQDEFNIKKIDEDFKFISPVPSIYELTDEIQQNERTDRLNKAFGGAGGEQGYEDTASHADSSIERSVQEINKMRTCA